MLNQSGEEPIECPLCMEPLEVDDLTFFPCTCGYQICRFCWHRIRTDENGLCPACRKAYPENPADFRPLSREEVARLKAQKKQKDQKRKQKIMENRKHLANVRVVQRNLVFVVGLPARLADAEVLKKHEYFGKFGKIQKVVINQSTSYAGSQGPSASAYVTYQKADDALRAIQAVNNIVVDGRSIRSSLGTTKYCSHFLKNQMCPKADCMYLHELGEAEASFTKEEMQQGKHQDYEKKLHEQLLNSGKESRKSILPLAVTSSISQSTNNTVTNYQSSDTYTKEVNSASHQESSSDGHHNDNFPMASVSSCKRDGNHRKHKNYHKHNTDITNTSDEEPKRKEERHTKDECESKQIKCVQSRKQNSKKRDSDKISSCDKVKTSNGDLNVLESETNTQTNEISGINIGLNRNNFFCKSERENVITDHRISTDNNSFFSSDTFPLRTALKIPGFLESEKWPSPLHYGDPNGSTKVEDWALNSSSILVMDSSQLHSNLKNDKKVSDFGTKDSNSHKQNYLYLENNLPFSTKSKMADNVCVTTSIDGQTGIRSEANAVITNTRSQETEKPLIASNLSSLGQLPSFVHYDPAILMINQFSVPNNGSQLFFMNGQPSPVTKRFLEDIQLAQQHKENQFQQIYNRSENGDRELFDVKRRFNFPHYTSQIPDRTEEVHVNKFQNWSDNVDNMKGKHPPGFLYHQHKNKDSDVKYINSVINPIMSTVQIADSRRTSDDELGFDPFHETQKALAEMMEKERMMLNGHQHNSVSHIPEHFSFNHQQALDDCHPLDLYNSRQQHILPQQNHRFSSNVTGCSKLLDGLGLSRGMSSGNSLPKRTRLPPPGFATPHHIQAFGISQTHSDADM